MKFYFSHEKVYGAEGCTLRTLSKEFEPIPGMRYRLMPILTAPRQWEAVEASLNWTNAPEGFEILMNGQLVQFEKPADIFCNVTVTPFFSQNRLFFSFEPPSDEPTYFTQGSKNLLRMWMRVVQQNDHFVLELDIIEDPLP